MKCVLNLKNSVICAKNSLILASTRKGCISRGWATKMEFPEGVGDHFVSQFWKFQRRGGVVGKIPSMGVWINFWNYTIWKGFKNIGLVLLNTSIM